MFDVMRKFGRSESVGHKLAHAVLYLLLIAPPRAFDIKKNQVQMKGELAQLPTFVIVMIELIVRVAIILLIATGLESQFGDELYETYKMDIVFSVVVTFGAVHSVIYYVAFGMITDLVSARTANKLYRFIRNGCYAVLPGFACIIPVLIIRWDREQAPFEDGFAFQIYIWTTIIMLSLGVIEALFMNREPLGTAMPKGHTPKTNQEVAP